jgi:trypsin
MRVVVILIMINMLLGVSDARKRIVGGDNVIVGEFPFYVWTSGTRLCGGSIIWGDFIITAAHCAQAYSTSKNVRYGSTSRYVGTVLPIDRLISHPDFDTETMANDIMLVKLKQYSSRLRYVTLNSDPLTPAEGVSITGMGYGSDGMQDTTTKLMKVKMPSVGYSKCVETYDDMLNDNQMTCTGGSPEGGKDTCVGDSGGPMMIDGTYTQIGIVSWGAGCAEPNTPSINTRISTYMPWIKEQVCMYSAVSPPWNCPLKVSALSGILTNNATSAPANRQTMAPLQPPTLAPVQPPTMAPVQPPTSAPINKPTKAPVRKITKAPVRKPTKAPIIKKTRAPVIAPTKKPTKAKATLKPILTQIPGFPPAPVPTIVSGLRSIFGNQGTTTTTAASPLQQQCYPAGSPCDSDSQCCGISHNRCALVPGQLTKQCMITS